MVEADGRGGTASREAVVTIKEQIAAAVPGLRTISGIAVFKLDPPELFITASLPAWDDKMILEHIRWANSFGFLEPGHKMPGKVYIPYYELKAEGAS